MNPILLRFITVTVAMGLPLFDVSSAPAAESVPDPGDPANGTWRVCLDGFFPPSGKKNAPARRPLPIDVISREG